MRNTVAQGQKPKRNNGKTATIISKTTTFARNA